VKKVTVEELLAKAEQAFERRDAAAPFYKGKVQVTLKCRIKDFNDFAIWYTPGVAAVCKAITADKDKVYEMTNKWNSVAVVSDGSASSAWVTSVLKRACRSWKVRPCSTSI